MKDEHFLYQHKEMLSAKSHGVKKEDLETLRHNAIDEHLLPCYIIEYDGRRWFMIDENTWNEKIKQWH